MAGESKGTKAASLGVERGDGDGQRQQETMVMRSVLGDARGRG
jgi:hypothetical protein